MDLVEMIMESEEFHVDIKLLVKINPIYLMELSEEMKTQKNVQYDYQGRGCASLIE